MPGFSEDRTATRHIPVYGAGVTVYGRNVPVGYKVSAFGSEVPLDRKQDFVVQRILPPGYHQVDVGLSGISKSGGLHFSREINVPLNDWFYVALADITIGKNVADSGIEMVRDGEYDHVYNKGRLAFYLKGKIKGQYLLTASADTGEDELKNLFRDFNSQSTQEVIRRIDPDEYYPVYGDASTSVDDAPTRGKLYVRLEKGDSHIVWGNYKTEISGSGFIQSKRSLYGGAAQYRSPEVTSFGENRTNAIVYAALPDTLHERNEFLGTGGSLYFLKRQDVIAESETVSIEYRSSVTGAVVSEEALTAEEDYTIDYFQGLVTLRKSLSASSSSSDGAVRSSSLGDTNAYLIVEYEYTPQTAEVDGVAHGASVQQWVNDKVRIGVSEASDKTGESDHQVVSGNVLLRHSEKTSLEADIARSKGLGSPGYVSTDGGLAFSSTQKLGKGENSANAWKLRGEADLEDLGVKGVKGKLSGSYENRASGFSLTNEDSTVGFERWDIRTSIDVTDKTTVEASHAQLDTDEGKRNLETDVSVAWKANERTKLTVGVKRTDLTSPSALAASKSGSNGSRIDLGLRGDYKINDDRSVYAFAQGTAQRSGDVDRNHRVGVGGKVRLTEKVVANAELSVGSSGLGAGAGLEYSPTADDKYYVGYSLDPDRATSTTTTQDLSGTDKGVITTGARKKISDEASAYTESAYDMYGLRKSLSQTYGVVYTPDAQWSVDTALSTGSIRDETIDPDTGLERSDFRRHAVSAALSYKDEDSGLRGRLKGEARHDDSTDGTRDTNTYALSSSLSADMNPDWRFLADADLVTAHGSASAITSRDYFESSVGFAYRPTENDRLNVLLQYRYLYDLPELSSLSTSGETVQQQSHIVSADLSYDLNSWLTVGTKQAMRFGKIKDDADEGWAKSMAYLGTARADFHVIKSWDVLVEGRVLTLPYTDTADYGMLAAAYRHLGDNFKIGMGYNFGRFSDDLRDIALDDQGLYLNLLGKY